MNDTSSKKIKLMAVEYLKIDPMSLVIKENVETTMRKACVSSRMRMLKRRNIHGDKSVRGCESSHTGLTET